MQLIVSLLANCVTLFQPSLKPSRGAYFQEPAVAVNHLDAVAILDYADFFENSGHTIAQHSLRSGNVNHFEHPSSSPITRHGREDGHKNDKQKKPLFDDEGRFHGLTIQYSAASGRDIVGGDQSNQNCKQQNGRPKAPAFLNSALIRYCVTWIVILAV